MLKKAPLLYSLIVFLGIFLSIAHFSPSQAWFGAGRTPGFPTTISGLAGEIALPQYKFAPDFYNLGDTVTINTVGFNSTSSDITSNYYLVIRKVTQSPIGTDINDGEPTTPGTNENDLYSAFTAGNNVEQFVTSNNLGNITFPAQGQTTFGSSYTTTEVGYYHFSFVDVDPTQDPSGHVLTTGFFRVLDLPGAPTPTPTLMPTPTSVPTAAPTPTTSPEGPTPTPAPTGSAPTPTSTPGITPTAAAFVPQQGEQGNQSALGKDGPTCSNGSVKVTMDLRDGNRNPVAGTRVRFTYRGSQQESTSNSNGRAEANYGFNGADSVFAQADGFPSQALFIDEAKNCPAVTSTSTGTVLGLSTEDPAALQLKRKKAGQVLGASTLAATGTAVENTTLALALGLMMMGGTGIWLYSKE